MHLRSIVLCVLTAAAWSCTPANNPDVVTACPMGPIEIGQTCAGYQPGLRCPGLFSTVCTGTEQRVYGVCTSGMWVNDCDSGHD